MEIMITTFIAAYGPAIASALGSFATAFAALFAIRRHFKTIETDTSYQELITQLNTIIGQNESLRRQNKQLMEKITHTKED